MPTAGDATGVPARFAVFSGLLAEFEVVRQWLREAGHELALVVTQPTRRGLEVAAAAEPETVVVVTRRVAACRPLLEEAAVDAGIICAFGRVPMALVERTRHGIVNLHPALLPDYPGPNPLRALYEGERRLGVTLHRIVEEFDAGPILAQVAFDLPPSVDPASFRSLASAATFEVLAEGVPRALADEPGTPQQPGAGPRGTVFAEDEELLGWDLPAGLLEARTAALLLAGRQPRALVGDSIQPVRRLRRLAGFTSARPGVVHASGRRALVGVADGVVELDLGELPYG